jgi:hypothetical protein
MAASLSEFTQAVQAFNGNMRQLATSKAVGNATQQVKLINEEVKDEGEKRVALQNLSNELALRLTGIGADPSQVSQAAGAVAPQAFQSAGQAILEGSLSSRPELAQRGLAAQRLTEGTEQGRFDRQMRLQEAKFELDKAQLEGTSQQEALKGVTTAIEMAGLNVTRGTLGELTKDQRSAYVGNVSFGSQKVSAIAADPVAARELREKFSDMQGTNAIIDELRGLADKPFASVRPQVVATARALASRLKALVRIDVTGGGNISDNEQKLLEQVAANPVSIFNVAGGPQAALDTLQKAVNRGAAGILQQSGVQMLAPLTAEEQQAIKYIKQNPKDPRAEETIRLIEQNRQLRGARMALE